MFPIDTLFILSMNMLFTNAGIYVPLFDGN